ncbi:MAG: prolipoprotein diacylglyceryl transferase [Bacteroidia bacterium]|nr:prolipoprotein diacylglyceryl transferase [Bacteroidia bacterium]
MYPELFHIGGFTIYSYGLCILLGVVAAYIYFSRQTKAYGLSTDKVSEMFLWCVAAVFVGGKVFYFLEKPSHYLAHPSDFFENFGSGFVFYGSFLTAVPVLIWWFRKEKLPVWDMFDFIGVGGAMVHAFGKLGCFMAGCCHGKVCHSSWGVVFNHPQTHADPAGVPLYPVQLWDIGIITSAIIIMLLVQKRKQFAGQLFLIYGLWYAAGRYFTENYRGDEERGYLFNGLVTHSQFIAILVFAICLGIYIWRLKTARIHRGKDEV